MTTTQAVHPKLTAALSEFREAVTEFSSSRFGLISRRSSSSNKFPRARQLNTTIRNDQLAVRRGMLTDDGGFDPWLLPELDYMITQIENAASEYEFSYEGGSLEYALRVQRLTALVRSWIPQIEATLAAEGE